MTDDTLVAQLRGYAEQLDELPVEPRLARVSEARWRPPRWTRREWIALAAAIAVLVAVAVARIADQSSGTGPSVSTGGKVRVERAWTRDLGAQVDRTIDAPGGRTIVDIAPETTGDSTLVALDRSTGRVLWRHRFPFRNGPWGLDGTTLVTAINGRTAGIDVRTGQQRWLVDVNAVSGEQAPPILVHDHVAYLVGGDAGVDDGAPRADPPGALASDARRHPGGDARFPLAEALRHSSIRQSAREGRVREPRCRYGPDCRSSRARRIAHHSTERQ